MASEPLRPGVAPGLDLIVEQQFEVPVVPAIGRAEAARRVRAKIEADGIRCERLDVSDLPVTRRALFDMAGTRVSFPAGEAYESCYVALVDPTPDTLWGHPAHWAFVPAAGDGVVILQPTDFPENALGAVRLRPEPRQ